MAANVIFTTILLYAIKPFDDPDMHRRTVFNEVFTVYLMYHFMCFTPFLPDMSTKILVGFSFCYLEVAYILTNLGVATYHTWKNIRLRFRLY